MTSKRQSTEQRRAASAWKDINSVKDGNKSEYKTRAKNLAAMIQINGLGSTMAFLRSKEKEAYTDAFQHVSNWVMKEVAGHDEAADSKKDDLMDLIRESDVNTYRRATREAIEYAIWLKRYVEGWENVKEAVE